MELSCGTGLATLGLAQASQNPKGVLVATDFSSEMIKKADANFEKVLGGNKRFTLGKLRENLTD